METLAFPLSVTMQRSNTEVVSVSIGIFDYGYLVTTRVLHNNDGFQSNTSQYWHVLRGSVTNNSAWIRIGY
jgi:hypothetical protein